MKPPSPLERPTFRNDLPIYPPTQQLIRLTQGTVEGPAGVAQLAGSSVSAGIYYVAFTQQRRTDSGLPRDREPCLAQDVNGLGLVPGFYLGRLAGSHSSLPVYEIIGSTGSIGPQGPQGESGPTGSTGDPGTQGTQGQQGEPGPTGATGSTGNPGTMGTPGPIGPAGSCGPCGSDSPTSICSLLRELPNYNGGIQQLLGHDANGSCRWYDVEEC